MQVTTMMNGHDIRVRGSRFYRTVSLSGGILESMTSAQARFTLAFAVAFAMLGDSTFSSAATIRGTVRTSEGSALPGARITLATLDTSVVLEARSSSDGAYEFPNVSAATWRIGASRPGRAYSETLRVVATSDVVQD